MKAIVFKQVNRVLTGQKKVGGGKTRNIPHRIENNGQTITCWKASWKERLGILFHGKIWIGIHNQAKQPPMFVSAVPNAYITKKKNNEDKLQKENESGSK